MYSSDSPDGTRIPETSTSPDANAHDIEEAGGLPLDKGAQGDQAYPPFREVLIIMVALYLAIFLIALVLYLVDCRSPKPPC